MARTGILFILVGPSGAGKNTLMKRVQRQVPDLTQLPTATTRERREDEVEGREHRFVSRDQFEELIATGALVEYQPVHVGDLYGTPRDAVVTGRDSGQDLIADIEFLGASQIHAEFPEHTVLVFVTPSNLDNLAERIRQRGEISPQDLADRLARARFELAFAPQCDYVILNDLVEPAAEHLRQIVVTERARRRGEPIAEHDLLREPLRHVSVSPIYLRDRCLLTRHNGRRPELPTFPLEDLSVPPHAALEARLEALLGRKPEMDAVTDERFNFVPPFHVDVSVIPHDVYLTFYYRCYSPLPGGDGWAWERVSDLVLPTTLVRRIQAADAAG